MAIEFGKPVRIDGPDGPVAIGSAKEALKVLSDTNWSRRRIEHAQAVDAALKVIDGHRSAIDARDALIRAAREAGTLIED